MRARALPEQALGCDMLPRLWRWLAPALGLPLEAPAQATRGWDIAALVRGVPGVAPHNAAVFGLFCRSGSCCLPPGSCWVVTGGDSCLHEMRRQRWALR